MLSPVIYSGYDHRNPSLAEKIMVTSHRGAGGMAPENTLASIGKGLESRADRIEIDVRQTKDKVIVCMHDANIDRTTDGKGLVSDLTYNQIVKHSAGIKFSKKYVSEKVPTLEQAMNLVGGKAPLVIEIKEDGRVYPGIEKRVVELIQRHNAKDWVIIHSFNDSVLINIHKLNKDLKLHKLLVTDFPFLKLIYDNTLKVTSLEYYDFVDEFSVFYPFATKRLINRVHAQNKKINVWTVNDSLKINRLINLGIDGIITDYPKFAK